VLALVLVHAKTKQERNYSMYMGYHVAHVIRQGVACMDK